MTMNSTNAILNLMEVTPDKSPNDGKDYKYLILPNGLKVLLVSVIKSSSNVNKVCHSIIKENEKAHDKLSAVALLVNVGSFAQPKRYQSLAHLLERIIFMGSNKYSPENSLDEHITKYGGVYNACTDAEDTFYFFEITQEHLESSLAYFSAQLKEPLILRDYMAREREAMDSEFQSILNNDFSRQYYLLHSLATTDYPHENLIWGNLKSLKEDIESEEDLLENLHAFFTRHYSAQRMCLCMQAPLTLEDLEKLAFKYFADYPRNEIAGWDFSRYKYQLAFKKEFYEEVFFVKPIENVCYLNLTWVLPSTLEFYKCKPQNFLAYLLRCEGEGSLCAFLRKRLFASEVISETNSNSIFTLFSLNITLTDRGFKHLSEVLKATFAYIQLFKSAAQLKSLYEELSHVKSYSFRFMTEYTPLLNVQHLAKCCKYFSPEDILTGSELYFEYNEQQVQEVIEHLQKFHFNIMITSKHAFDKQMKYDKKEKWFGTEYTTRKMPEEWQDLWHNNTSSKEIKELYLPKPNPFVAKDFHIFAMETNGSQCGKYPQRIMQTDCSELWFRQDDKFLLPHVSMNFYIMSSFLRETYNNVLCRLYLNFVNYHLLEKLYPATIAGISYEITCLEKGIFLTLEGFNDKLYVVVDLIMKTLIASKDYLNELQFETFKNEELKYYLNSLLKPDVIANDIFEYIVKDKYDLMLQKYKILKEVTLNDVKDFAQNLTKEFYVQSLIQGNVQKETALELMTTITNTLNCKNIKENTFCEDRGTEIPLGAYKILSHNLNPLDGNSIVKNFYQIGPYTLRNECILNLIMIIIENPLYCTLRSQDQLGYRISCSLQKNNNIMGYMLEVNCQEPKHTAQYVQERMEIFHYLCIQQHLKNLSAEEFEISKNSLIKLRQVEDLSLQEEFSRNWHEIISKEYLFERKEKEIECFRRLEKQDIVDFWSQNLNNNLRKLPIQVVGNKCAAEYTLTNKEEDFNSDLKFFDYGESTDNMQTIVDIKAFKDKLFVYPVVKTKLE